MFTVTASAAEEILRAAHSQPDAVDPPMLRVAAKFGEDGEIVYGMGFDEEREHDQVVECGGLLVLIAPRSQELLDGTTLDFVALNPGEFQFIFKNPHQTGADEKSASGCGSCGGGRCGG